MKLSLARFEEITGHLLGHILGREIHDRETYEIHNLRGGS